MSVFTIWYWPSCFILVKALDSVNQPTGGGEVNPAWDFQFIVPDFEVGKKYSFQARVMYKEFKGPDEVLAKYKLWEKENNQR